MAAKGNRPKARCVFTFALSWIRGKGGNGIGEGEGGGILVEFGWLAKAVVVVVLCTISGRWISGFYCVFSLCVIGQFPGVLPCVDDAENGKWESIRSIMDGARHFWGEREDRAAANASSRRRVRKRWFLESLSLSLPRCLRLICIVTSEF